MLFIAHLELKSHRNHHLKLTHPALISIEKYTFDPMAKDQKKFIVSARKYRPESWQEVIGQQSIIDTLVNSIAQNHMAHAYLFCGPRGVGKTTCARIFAKEINRSDEHDENEDFAFNVFELDAASNNKVEDIRSLTEQVRIPPQVGKYRVYIIDEVHMLSKAAFNAFLKTLEEPPAHAIFILATTEKHKIIPTILSRCQIYDFNRITIEDITSQLKQIAANEGIKYEEEALHVIAQKADGAMRDALSIFDQLASFTSNNLTYEAVLKNLHVLDYDYFFEVTDHLYTNQYAEALVVLDKVLNQGFEGSHFVGGLAGHFRDLLVCKHPKTIALLEVGDSVKEKYHTQSKTVDAYWLMESLKIATEVEFKYRNSGNQRLLVETMLLNLAGISAEKKNDNPEHLEERVTVEKKTPSVQIKPVNPAPEPSPLPQNPEVTTEKLPAKEAPSPKEIETQNSSKRKRRASTISLKVTDEIQGAALEPEIEDRPQSQSETDSPQVKPITLADAWKALCDQCLTDGKNALYTILVKQQIDGQLLGNSLTIHLSHQIEQEEFSLHSADVLATLRNTTGNHELNFETTLSEQKTGSKLFTATEKFQYLADKNPLLHKLKQDLDLDISH